MENGGAVHRTVRWLVAETGCSGGDPHAGAGELIGVMWEAFDITLGQAWTGANRGGSLSDARLVLSDGACWGFVVCGAVRVYRFGPPGEAGAGE